MSITRMKYGDLEYFKVARAWNSIERQEYIRIRNNDEKAYQEAVKLDKKLAERQWAYNELIRMSGDIYFHKNGTIVGLGLGVDSKSLKPVFKLRIQTPHRKQPYMTSVSIAYHGFDKAFQMAIDKTCAWHQLPEDHKVRGMMLDAKAHYQSSEEDKSADIVPIVQENVEESADLDAIEKKLLAEIEDFNQRRHVIRG